MVRNTILFSFVRFGLVQNRGGFLYILGNRRIRDRRLGLNLSLIEMRIDMKGVEVSFFWFYSSRFKLSPFEYICFHGNFL